MDSTLKECGTPVGDAAPPANFNSKKNSSTQKITARFVDTLAAIEQATPTGFATYAVEVLNTANRGAGISNQVRVPLVPTIAPFNDFAARATAKGVLISWLCAGQAKRNIGTKYLFRIYRRGELSTSETRIAELDATECAAGPSGAVESSSQASNSDANRTMENDKLVTSFLDLSFEWEHTYFYRGTVVSVVEKEGKPTVEVEGDDTPEVKVFADDVFPPAVPSGLQAVFSGPGQQPFIDLIWAPVTDADLAGYNVYWREEGSATVKLNSEPVKTPAFRDMQVDAGKTYFYSVSSVDQRGNESARSDEASERVP
ncbi:MAG: hypothetical protein ABSA78_18605 [Candidatus Sulfotelmatobacter sp.]|jgi:hypothetical protein